MKRLRASRSQDSRQDADDTVMNLYYAMGGGLGHLTRARAFLENYDLENESLILTSSPFSNDKRVIGNFPVINVEKSFENDRAGFQKYLQYIVADFKIKRLFVDSFPFGIINEFVDFQFPENVEINYIARHLKWKNYANFTINKLPTFHQTYILEPLDTKHQEFINRFSKQQTKIELNYSHPTLNAEDKKIIKDISKKFPFWLIIHSGSNEEISELINFAEEMREIENTKVNLILISPEAVSFQKSNLFHFNFYPASVLFEPAERIFTACGFNAVEQTKFFRNKHFFIPFERRFDDQFERARRIREFSANP